MLIVAMVAAGGAAALVVAVVVKSALSALLPAAAGCCSLAQGLVMKAKEVFGQEPLEAREHATGRRVSAALLLLGGWRGRRTRFWFRARGRKLWCNVAKPFWEGDV
jgi:hypothetical protein